MTVWYNEHRDQIGLYQGYGYRHAMWTKQAPNKTTLYGHAIRLTGKFKSQGWVLLGAL